MIIIKYFYFISIPIALLNAITCRAKLLTKFQNNEMEKSRLNNFVKYYFLSFSVPFTLIGLIQIHGGYETPLFFFPIDLNNIHTSLPILIFFLCWILYIYWILLKNGAELLLKYREAFNLPSEIKLIKIISLLPVFGGVLGLFIANNIMK